MKLYQKLIACTLSSIILILGISKVVFHTPLSNRIGFAILISVVPALFTGLLFWFTKWDRSWSRVVLVYFVTLVGWQAIQHGLRWIM